MGKKRSRASRAVRVVGPDDGSEGMNDRPPRKNFRSELYRTNAILEDKAQASQEFLMNLRSLDDATISAISAMRGEEAPSANDPASSAFVADDHGIPMDDGDDDWHDMDEDGVELSDDTMRELMEFSKRYRQTADTRTWRQRVARADENWSQVTPQLIEAYLRWKYPTTSKPAFREACPSPGSPTCPDISSSTAISGDSAGTSGTSSSGLPSEDHATSPHDADMPTECPASSPQAPVAPITVSPNPQCMQIKLDALDILSTSNTVTVTISPMQTSAEALVANGYLGNSPIRPSLAISLWTLELLRRIRLFKPSFSIEAFAKMTCYYYKIPYRRKIRNALSDAFDIYLAILRGVDKKILKALGRDTPDWRVKNACPACCYKLADEPERPFSRMYAMDGNNSLKRMRPLGSRKAGDVRIFEESDYFLPQEFVNKFANEVPPRARRVERHPVDSMGVADAIPGAAKDDSVEVQSYQQVDSSNQSTQPPKSPRSHRASLPIDDDDIQEPVPEPDGSTPSTSNNVYPAPLEESVEEDMEGDPTDGAAVESSCTKNWKAAQSDDKKRSWDVFEETGIFASACRHGFILWVIDMVRSGELARLPLATVAKILDVCGARTVGGYDVGCSLIKTIERSSLGPRFKELLSRLCVNAFHGYSHEYSCQVQHHPNSIVGVGLEDFETMERIFSFSNHLAPIIRYATAYRRRVLIDLFFQQWDADRYLNLGKMLYDNYRQALGIIKEQGLAVAEAMRSLGLTEQDLVLFMEEERSYLSTLGKESEGDLHEIAYVSALQELRMVCTELAKSNRQFLAAAPQSLAFLPPHSGPTDYNADLSKTRKIETHRKYLDERRKTLTMEVADLEVHLGIAARWQPSDPQYMRVASYIATRKYQVALANLQRLVVQRLFELHKMNISQTGYRMRRHIAKNMQTRSRAIRNAINAYNSAAAALDPPRPKLEWETISHYQFLEEFDLLNETRADIRQKPWAQPAIRETLRQARRVARAREEIVQVHVEARRIHTSIVDEDNFFGRVLAELSNSGDSVHGAVLEFVTRRRTANAHVLANLKKLYRLPEFSGNPSPGRRFESPDRVVVPMTDIAELVDLAAEVVEEDERAVLVDEDFEEDDTQEQITGLADFLASLAV